MEAPPLMQQQHMHMNSPSRGDAAALQEIVYELKRENSLLAGKYHEDLGGLRQQMQQERDETARAVQDTARVVAQLDAEKQSYAGIHTQSQKDLAEILGHAENLSQAVESLELELTTVKTERDSLEKRNVQLSKATEWTVSRGRLAHMLDEGDEAQPVGLGHQLADLSQKMKSEAQPFQPDANLEPGVSQEMDHLAGLLEAASKELQHKSHEVEAAAEEKQYAQERIAELEAKLAAKDVECVELRKTNRSLAVENQCTMEQVGHLFLSLAVYLYLHHGAGGVAHPTPRATQHAVFLAAMRGLEDRAGQLLANGRDGGGIPLRNGSGDDGESVAVVAHSVDVEMTAEEAFRLRNLGHGLATSPPGNSRPRSVDHTAGAQRGRSRGAAINSRSDMIHQGPTSPRSAHAPSARSLSSRRTSTSGIRCHVLAV
jgi:hypothetical protein